MSSDTRNRYNIALDQLKAMKTSTSSAEFSPAFLGFLTWSCSVLNVARSEAAKSTDQRHYFKRKVDDLEKDGLVSFFIDARNDALKESKYEGMHSVVFIEPTFAIRFRVEAGDVLVSPSRGIDESHEPKRQVLELEMRETKTDEAKVPTKVSQDFFFATGKYKGQSVNELSGHYLRRLEPLVDEIDQSIQKREP
jgi:hypothetical protein